MDPKPFSLQIDSFLGTATGAIIAILDPEPAAACSGAKAMPPLWQYFSPLLKKPDERIAAPKG